MIRKGKITVVCRKEGRKRQRWFWREGRKERKEGRKEQGWIWREGRIGGVEKKERKERKEGRKEGAGRGVEGRNKRGCGPNANHPAGGSPDAFRSNINDLRVPFPSA